MSNFKNTHKWLFIVFCLKIPFHKLSKWIGKVVDDTYYCEEKECFYIPQGESLHVMYNIAKTSKQNQGAVYTIMSFMRIFVYAYTTSFGSFLPYLLLVKNNKSVLENALTSSQESPTKTIIVQTNFFLQLLFVITFTVNIPE